MNNNILFSVLIITYNEERYIRQTLDSVLSQKHKYPYEIVIGDDCSSDNTSDILKEYKEKYPQLIKLKFNSKNQGLIRNFFDTFSMCEGKYTMVLAGDDWWLPGKVLKQISFLEKHSEYGLTYGLAKMYNERTCKYRRKLMGKKTESFESLLVADGAPALTICFKTSLMNEYVKEVDPLSKNWLMEDYPYLIWFSLKSKVYFMKDTLGVYRNRTNSVAHPASIDKYITLLKSQVELKSYFISKYSNLFLIDKEIINKCLIINESRIRTWKMVVNKNFSKEEIYKECEKIENKNFKEKLLLVICKSNVLFYFFRKWLDSESYI